METRITGGPSGGTTGSSASFTFDTDNTGTASFECSLDGGAFTPCTSPATYNVSSGSHSFQVRSSLPGGHDQTPASRQWTVAYALGGFQAPVDNAPTVNTGKPGRTYPVKFKLTDALGNPVTAVSAITAVDYKATSCSAFTSDPTDALEANTTASSGLRYDGASGSFIYNWASPSAAGCYTLFIRPDTGQNPQYAYFNLK